MNGFEELRRENEALRDRTGRLTAAILRISASLDVDTVLEEVVDSARALTGARGGVITTIDEAGRPLDFVSSGLTPKQPLSENEPSPEMAYFCSAAMA